MKKVALIITIVLVVLLILTISCQSSSSEKLEDTKTEMTKADEGLNKVEEDYLVDMEVYKKDAITNISLNEQSIKEFKDWITNSKKEVKADYAEKINVLEQKNADLKQRLDEYNLEGKEQWISFKTEFSRDMNELDKALEELIIDNSE